MAERIAITSSIWLEPSEIELSFIRASGPGGQNVNKVSSAVQLRFDLMGSPSLPDGIKARAARLAGTRLTSDGEIVITAANFRSQPQNRDDAIARLVELLQQASFVPKRRVATRPTLGSKQRRLDTKARHGATKRLRTDKPAFE